MMMKKIVINTCYGGFGLSPEGVMRYAEIKGIALYPWIDNISKKVYGERAVVGNEDILHHYSLSPVVDGERKKGSYFSIYDIFRDDIALIQLIEEMGVKADGSHSELKIVEIPDDVEWVIEEYDGIEWIAEKHRRWE